MRLSHTRACALLTSFVVLDRGRIIEHGSHQVLLEKRGAYYEMARLQAIG